MSLLPKSTHSRVLLVSLSLVGAVCAIGLSSIPVSQAAPGSAPILVVTNSAYTANRFGAYLGEILRAEGLNAYDTVELNALTAADLTAYQVVVLAETSLSASQAVTFTNYVAAGGRLIAMRPDAQIKGLFGLGTTMALSQTTAGYLQFAAGPSPTAGLTTSPLQLHVPADHYAVGTGETLATLYSTPTTTTGFPAVVRSSDGQAVAFTYDLAQNVVYTRQGNPALANRVDTLGAWDVANPPVTRTVHLFGSPDITNSVPVWIDRDLIPVPQADEQMRLLARLVKEQIETAQPVPQLWYFPGTAKTMLILTGDAHANPSSAFDRQLQSLSARNAPITLYMTIGGSVTDLDASIWEAQGNTFGIHPYVWRVDSHQPYNVTNLAEGYTKFDAWFSFIFPSLTRSRTVRHHQVAWQGWTEAADIAVANGVALDTNFYHWGPWLQKTDGTWPHGYLTGSGQTMKFIRADGTVLPLYQQLTELVDEQLIAGAGGGYEGLNAVQGIVASQALIDASQAGDYAALLTQFHVDYYSGDVQSWAEGTVDYANSIGVPVWNADDWLAFTETRHDAAYTDLAWNAATRTLTFTLAAAPNAGLTLTTLLPVAYSGYGLTAVQVDGAPATATPLTIKNQPQAAVTTTAGLHTFVATYTSPLPGGALTQTTYADFAPGCAVTSNVHASDQFGGALILDSALKDDFNGASLSGQWQTGVWGGEPYTPTVSGGVLTLPPAGANGGYVRSVAAQGPGVLEIVAEVGSGVDQHFGYGDPDAVDIYRSFFFSTSSSTTQLFARASNGFTSQMVSVGTIPAGSHRYRIEWQPLNGTTERARYYIDGQLKAEIDIATGQLYDFPPGVFFSNNGAGTLVIEAIQESPDFAASGTYTSCVLDAGADYAWDTVRWDATLVASTTLTVETRASFDQTVWSPWTVAATASGTALSQPWRYAQYRLTLATTDVLTTPVVNAVTFDYSAQALALAKSDGGVSPTLGQAVPFTLTITVPATTTYDLQITDTLPAGYVFDSAGITLTGLSPLPSLTPVVSAPNNGTAPVTVAWNLGTVVAVTDTVRLVYSATVANVAGNQQGTVLTNTVQLVNRNSLNARQPARTAADSLTLREPALTIAKTALSPASQVYPGGVAIYQVVIGHPGGVNTSPAYNVVVTDALPAQLQLAGPITVTAGGVNASAGNILTVTAAALAAGDQITITYPVTLSTGLTSGQSVNNTATATWTSQPGGVAQERTGAGGLNDYQASSSASMTVTTPALSLGAGGSAASLQPNQTLTYSFVVTNSSAVPASGVALTATLPATFTIQSVSNGGGQSGSVATWTGLAVPGNSSVTRTVTAQLNTPVQAGLTQVVITAAVRDDGTHGAELSLANNAATTLTGVDAQPDLGLAVSDGGASVTPGAAVTYTLTYSNAGNQDAVAVELTATVPTDTTFYLAGSTGAWNCADNSAAGTVCALSVGDLAGGGGASGSPVKFAVTVTNPVPAGGLTLTLNAGVADSGADGVDPNPVNNTGTDTTPIIAAPNLNVTVSDGGLSGFPGELITYTVAYSNTGNRGASGAALSTTVPLNTLFSAAGSAAGWTCPNGSPAGTVCQNSLGIVAGGGAASVTVPFVVVVDIPMPAGGHSITATVAISDNGLNGTDPVPGNNQASDSTPLVSAPNLSLELRAPAQAAPGDVLSYTVAYSNTGNEGVASFVMTLTVPSGTLFIPARSHPDWVCPANAAGSACTWAHPAQLVGAGAGGVVTFTVGISTPAAAGLNVIAAEAVVTGTSPNERTLTDNTAPATTVLQAAPNLAVSVNASVNEVSPGGAVTYTLAYTNSGNQGAAGVVLTATVPAEAAYNAGRSTPGWTCAPGGGVACTWAAGLLGGGQSGAPVVLVVDVLNPVSAGASALAFTARIGDDGANGLDPVSGDNQAQVTTPLTGALADLAVSLKGGTITITVGSLVNYNVEYANLGNRGASGVVVTATLPAGTSLDSAGSSGGWVCAAGTCTHAIGAVAGGGAGGVLPLALQTTDVPAPSQMQLQVRLGDDGLNGEAALDNNVTQQTTPVIPAIQYVYLPLITRGG